MAEQNFLALDIGAESGRAIVGTLLDGEELKLREIYRFTTGQLSLNKRSYWNVYRFYEEVTKALQICIDDFQIIPQSIGVDAWDVDFGILGKDGSLLRIPYSYRDTMTETSMPAFLEKMGRNEIYQITGIAFHKFNTLFQLHAMAMSNDPILQMAEKLLFIPDIINYMLTGEIKSEFTIATSSQLFNSKKGDWDVDIFRQLDLSVNLMPEVVSPGMVIGSLNDSLSSAVDVEGIKVIAVTSNETACAITSVPASGDDWAYISSGTFSLIGIENNEPIIDQRSMLFNFSNEGGAEGAFDFLKSIMGLWLLQQCKKIWDKSSGTIDYHEIIRLAKMAEPFKAMIDPDYPGFYSPLNMPAAIETFCRHSNQVSPQGIGPVARTILEGLALKYRMVLEQLELLTGRVINVIHIIGGGAQNELLCQFTANATGRRVVAGPVEATAIGNILVQAIGSGYLNDIEHAREIVKNSFELVTYEPEDMNFWEDAYNRFQELAKRN